ncbi:primosome assembly protein PriA, partial [mine drainage metagenome]
MTGTPDIGPILRVALPTPLRRLFDYRSAEAGSPGTGSIEPGMRVWVPFGRRRLIGVVMESATRSALSEDKLKTVLEPLDSQPVFDRAMLAL